MRSIPFVLLFATVAVSFTACTGPRYASSSEYDDVYFTKADIAAPVAVNNYDTEDYDYDQQPQRFQREPVDSYRDQYYADDDFTFSRRIRRFNQSNRNSWRYYDPYYSNDLYYVINSPSWNTWNNNGWYNWNSPRFGSYYSAFNDPFAFSYSPYRSWGALNSWSSFAYDPFVGAYYGAGPFGSPFNNPFNSPFGFNSFGAGYNAGFGAGFNSAYYCPPIGFTPANSVWNRRFNNNNSQSYVSRTRNANTTTGNRPSTRTGINNTRPNSATQTRRSNSSNSQYLQPRTRTASANRPSTSRPGRTVGTNNANRTRTNTSRQSTTSSPRTYTRSNRSVTNSNRNNSSRTNRYNNTSRQSRTYSSPRNSSRNYNTSPRTNTNSGFNNNSRSNRSFSTPRNSSPSMNRSSSGSRSSSSRSSSSGVRRR